MSYVLIGANAAATSWGSGINATILAAMVTASARYTINNNGQDITGLGVFATSEIPGVLSADVTIGGFAGASPALGTSCSVVYASYTTAPYALSMQNLSLVMRTPAVHDITAGSSGSPATYMAFRPDIFQASASWTGLIDSGTALTIPNIPGDTLGTATFTYLSGATLALTGNIRTVGIQTVRGNKQQVSYAMNSVGTVTSSGGPFGTHTFGGTNNADPLWSAGGAATGALVLAMLGSTRKITFTDSFWKQISLSATPSAPVGLEIAIQPTGSFAFT